MDSDKHTLVIQKDIADHTIRRKWLTYTLFICGIAIIAVGLRLRIETAGDRKRVAKHIQNLTERVQRNPQDRIAVDEIIAILNTDWSFARTYACASLGKLGPIARPATADLIRALNSGDPVLEREAAIALGEVATDVPDAVEPLTEKLRNEDDDAAWFAARSLGKIGVPAIVAIPELEKAANSQNKQMAEWAKPALVKLKRLKAKGEERG